MLNSAGKHAESLLQRGELHPEDRETSFQGINQHTNKNVRIFQRAQEVCNMLIFPSDWESRWPQFARDMKAYRKEGGNAHDDAPDACTGIIEVCENYIFSMSDAEIMETFY